MTTKPIRTSAEEISAGPAASLPAVIAGSIARIDAKAGQLYVDFPGNEGRPLLARSLVTLDLETARRAEKQRTPIALVFEQGDRARPVLLGFIKDRAVLSDGIGIGLAAEELESRRGEELRAEAPSAAELDADEKSHYQGRNLVLEGEEQVVLRCGKAMIELHKDGKLIIRGAHVVSHADGVHRIRGGSIQIN